MSGLRTFVCRPPIIITSNKLFEEWDAVFSDKTLATAIIDRLAHHCYPIVIKGESYRIKERLNKANRDIEK